MNETRFEAERRKDDELRAKLDGESKPSGHLIMADQLRRESRRSIAAHLAPCHIASVTDCRQAKAYHGTFCLRNFDGGCQRGRPYAALCKHLRPRSVNRTSQFDDNAEKTHKD